MYATPERGGREGTEKEESTSKASTEERIKDVCVYYQVCLLTHCKAVVCKSSSRFVFLVELLFAADGVLHKIHRLGVRFVAINVSKYKLISSEENMTCSKTASALTSGGTIM